MPVPTPESIYLSASLLCAASAAVYDLRTHRIPNLLTGSSLLLGLLLHFAVGGAKQLVLAAAAGCIAGGIFILFYLAGGMGAGDVKLMTAVACMGGMHTIAELLAATAIMGGIFALGLAAYRGRVRETFLNIGALLLHHRLAGLRPHPELNLMNQRNLRLPYAVAIAAGCLITFSGQLGRR